jgi:hypothetical protein
MRTILPESNGEDLGCNDYLKLRKRKIEFLHIHMGQCPQRDAIEQSINEGDVESVSFVKHAGFSYLRVNYYSTQVPTLYLINY